MLPRSIEWDPASWPELGLAFASFRGIAVDRTPWATGGVAMQEVEAGEPGEPGEPRRQGRLRWMVRTAPDESLEGFRADHRTWTMTLGPIVSVCGQQIQSFVATHDAEDITCVMSETGNHPAWIPPRRAIAIQFTHRGLAVVASFEVESRDPEAWREVEGQFLGSLRCQSW